MVVNRKQPAAPAPASRSSSSQPIPTKKQPRPPPPSSTSNGNSTDTRKAAPVPAKQKPSASKQQKPVKQRPKSFLDRLFLLSLALFTAYSFHTCRPNPIFNSPSPYTPEPALCTSLSNYRTYFLEPYVLPPLKCTLTFTRTVSEPYVASAQTHLEPYLAPVQHVVTTTKPYIVRTYTIAKDLWQKTLVPLYMDTLKPYYEAAIVPRYVRYVQPQLEPLQKKASAYFAHYVSKPISRQYAALNLKGHELYVLHVRPYVRVVQPHARRIVETTSTYVVGLHQAYGEHVHPIVEDAWITARPLLCTAWKHFKAFAIQATDISGALIKRGLAELGVARKAYVDPHVSKIWDKVAEGNASVETKETPVVEDLPDIQTAEPIPEPTRVVSAESPSIPVPVQTTVESEQEPPVVVEPEPPVATPEETVEVPTKNVERTKAGVIPVVPEVEETPSPPKVPASPSPSSPSVTPEPDSDLDLDDFLRDIGVPSSDPAPPADQPESDVDIDLSIEQTEPAPPEDPVSEAERLAAVAAKRAGITARHDKWFTKLDEGVAKGYVEVQEAIAAVRNRAVTYVHEMAGKIKVQVEKKSEGEDEDERPLGVDVINGVQKDGERLLLGLSGWLRKAEARSIDWKVSGRAEADATIKQREEETKEMREAMVKREKEKWAQVIGKVEERFGEIVRRLESDVHDWYVGIRKSEGAEVMRIYTDVKSIAQKAQGDLGLDYAWLEDVTYNDWQRYHELMRIPERFLQTAKEMQEGTSTEPAAPEDPLIPALDALNADLQDVVRGFHFSLANTRSRATRAFSLRAAGTEDEESEGFFSVKDGEKRRDDLRGVDLGSVKKGVKEGTIAKKVGEGAGVLGVKEQAEEVKILPIDDTPKRTEEDGAFDASTVVIGKDKVQIEQALKDVPLETPAEVRHEEL